MQTERSETPIKMYWWDQRTNFGDLIGPWMVSMMTGRAVENTIWDAEGVPAPGLMTVGSMLPSMRRGGMDIWGSGAIRPFNAQHVARLAERTPRSIHAVRGWKTYKEIVSKLGWAVPKVYGDPALLLPRLYSPPAASGLRAEPCMVPHYMHKHLFGSCGEQYRIVNVEREPDVVVSEIALSSACVSTSLHGLIVAQAYEVPWVWLRIEDMALRGDAFKFEDFFSVLDRSMVSSFSCRAVDVSAEMLSSLVRSATLPKAKFNFDALYDSFPI